MPPEPPSAEVQAALDAAACGLARLSDDGTVRYANRTLAAWLGVDAAALAGRRLSDLLTVGGRIFYLTHWAPLLRMQGSISEVKLELLHADGTRLPTVLNAVRHQIDGEIVQDVAAFIARDRDRYEQELLQARRRLEALVDETAQAHAEAKDRALLAEQMLGIVSHDLRNPLSAIMMGAASLEQAELPPLQQRTVTRMKSATDRATKLIADLLDFTQARLGRGLQASPAPVDLHAVVAEALDELRLGQPGRELRHVRVGDGWCSADASRVSQLLGNLVANAVVYGERARPITVTTSVDPSACSLSVHNDGPPIPDEVQATIFERMTRGAAGHSASRSIGLGLFIVREIARAHGGTVSVRSASGEGTTFTATFPRAT